MKRIATTLTALLIGLGITGCEYGENGEPRARTDGTAGRPGVSAVDETARDPDEAEEARELFTHATNVLDQMKQDPKLAALLDEAVGVFIAPHYGKGALGVGARGGEGVVLVKRGTDQWSGPSFYEFGEITVGAQIGGAGGPIAMVLMSQRALDPFLEDQSFSLDANAGFTLIAYSADVEASASKADAVLWSNTKGLFAGISLGVSSIVWDAEATRAYYAEPVTSPEDVLNGSRPRRS